MKKLIVALLMLFMVSCIPVPAQTRMTLSEAIEMDQNQIRRDAFKIHSDSVYNKLINDFLKPWKLKTYIDDFGDETNNKYIITTVDGTFSNSATRNSYLFAQVIFDYARNISIRLREYSIYSPGVEDVYNMKISLKNSENEILNTYCSHYGDIKAFFIKSKGKIKIYISDKYSSTYSFIIDATGFTEALKQLN